MSEPTHNLFRSQLNCLTNCVFMSSVSRPFETKARITEPGLAIEIFTSTAGLNSPNLEARLKSQDVFTSLLLVIKRPR